MKQFGLIGYPLKNSFSQNYFSSKFLSLALLDYAYQNFQLAQINDIKQLLAENTDLRGLNITLPYKQSIIPYLDEIDDDAKKIGAVNCINIVNKKLKGYNTDAFGFEKSLLPLIQNKLPERALILGTGGASKAVIYILTKLGIDCKMVSRTPQQNIIGYENLTQDIIQSHTLIVNCTPLGMFPNTEQLPNIPYQFITAKHIAYDLIYLPIETQFLAQCKTQGAITKNGLEMLHLQAEKSWEIWNQPYL
jgi:shikimate dehydrogenase